MEKSTKGISGFKQEQGQGVNPGETAKESALSGISAAGQQDRSPGIVLPAEQTPGQVRLDSSGVTIRKDKEKEPAESPKNESSRPASGLFGAKRSVPFWMGAIRDEKGLTAKSIHKVSFPVVRTEIAHPSTLADRPMGNEFDRTTRDYKRLAAMGVFQNCPEITSTDREKPLRVLDVPTGRGDLARDLRGMGIAADGVDLELDAGQREQFFSRSGIENLAHIPDGSYDLALSLWGPFSYNYRGFDTYRATDELARVTAPGGKFVIAPIRNDAEEWLLDALGSRFDIQTHTIMVREFGNWGGSNTVYTVTV